MEKTKGSRTAHEGAPEGQGGPGFVELGIDEALAALLAREGIARPTPVQRAALPLLLAGGSAHIRAQTGSGKTLAFLLPIMQGLAYAEDAASPLLVVLEPTRELAEQTLRAARLVARGTGHACELVIGGASDSVQIERLQAGCDAVVATPGRLLDLARRGAADLSRVACVVVDEADLMLDMGFIGEVGDILARCPREARFVLASATLDPRIAGLGRYFDAQARLVDLSAESIGAAGVAHERIEVPHRRKMELLAALIEERGIDRAIVFARTHNRVETCARSLAQAGLRVAFMHGRLSPAQRRSALEAFDRGRADFLVATDILSRGIDVAQVPFVISIDAPHDPQDYVHRAGRCGRAGASGRAISLASPEERAALSEVERLMGISFEKSEAPTLPAGPKRPSAPKAKGAERVGSGAKRKRGGKASEAGRRSARGGDGPGARPKRDAGPARKGAPGRTAKGRPPAQPPRDMADPELEQAAREWEARRARKQAARAAGRKANPGRGRAR